MDLSPDPAPAADERLARLESNESARTLLARYARACDALDLDGLGALFAADSVLDIPGASYKGRDGIVGFYRQAFTDDPTVKTHFITNVTTRWLGLGRVAVDSYFLYTGAGDAVSILGWGEYSDVVDTTGVEPVFERKSISVRRAVDVRDGWALAAGGAS